jgi:hypothetical protein
MTADTKRQSALLAVLLAVLAGVLWWNVGGGAAPPASPGRAAPQPGVRAADPTPGVVEEVRLEALDAAPPEPATTGRDPFRFGAARQASLDQPIEAGPFGEPPPSTSGPSSNAMVPMGPGAIPLKFIGIVTGPQPGRKLAVLSDGRNPPFYGREGDIIEGRYRIVRIGVESIELAHVDGRGQQTIRLSGS